MRRLLVSGAGYLTVFIVRIGPGVGMWLGTSDDQTGRSFVCAAALSFALSFALSDHFIVLLNFAVWLAVPGVMAWAVLFSDLRWMLYVCVVASYALSALIILISHSVWCATRRADQRMTGDSTS